MSHANVESLAQKVGWDLHASGSLPRGRMSIVVTPVGGPRHFEIEVAQIVIPDRDDPAESISYDDGRVVVDRDDQGRVRAIEFLAHKCLSELPEFSDVIDREKMATEKLILRAAHATAMINWMRFRFFLQVSIADGTDVARRKLDNLDGRNARIRHALDSAKKHGSSEIRNWSDGKVELAR